MPTIVQIIDLNGQQLYHDHNSRITHLKAKKWYVNGYYTTDPRSFNVKVCSSKQAAINWATSAKRINQFGENAKFYIYHA